MISIEYHLVHRTFKIHTCKFKAYFLVKWCNALQSYGWKIMSDFTAGIPITKNRSQANSLKLQQESKGSKRLLTKKIADLWCSINLKAELTFSWKIRILMWTLNVSGGSKSCYYSIVSPRDGFTRVPPLAILNTLKASPDEDEVPCISQKKLKIAYFPRHVCFARFRAWATKWEKRLRALRWLLLKRWNAGTDLNSERRTTKTRNTKLPKTPGTQKKSHTAK